MSANTSGKSNSPKPDSTDNKVAFVRACASGSIGAVVATLPKSLNPDSKVTIDTDTATFLNAPAALEPKQTPLTPLEAALGGDHYDIAETLVHYGASVDGRLHSGETLLITAAGWGLAEVVEWLLGKGANPDALSTGEVVRTALHAAAVSNRNLDTVTVLLGGGATVDALNGFGSTPLTDATAAMALDVMKALIEAGADVEGRGVDLAAAAAAAATVAAGVESDNNGVAGGRGESVSEVDEGNGTQAGDGGDGARRASGTNDTGSNSSSDPKSSQTARRTPLGNACSHGCVEAIALLLRAGADPGRDYPTNSSFDCGHRAFECGLLGGMGGEGVALFKEAGFDLNAPRERGRTPLSNAIMQRDRASVAALCQGGADVEYVDPTLGRRPLQVAYRFHYPDLVETLLRHGADVNSGDGTGFTLAHMASTVRGRDLVPLVFQYEAELNAWTYGGATPLACAAYSHNAELCARLIAGGAEPNATCLPRDPEYDNTELAESATGEQLFETPLGAVLEQGTLAPVRALLLCGADLDVCTHYQVHYHNFGESDETVEEFVVDRSVGEW